MLVASSLPVGALVVSTALIAKSRLDLHKRLGDIGTRVHDEVINRHPGEHVGHGSGLLGIGGYKVRRLTAAALQRVHSVAVDGLKPRFERIQHVEKCVHMARDDQSPEDIGVVEGQWSRRVEQHSSELLDAAVGFLDVHAHDTSRSP